jgi:hypothetical protein
MDLIQDIGAVAGLAAFIGLAVLALLYFAQARDVRSLRERAAFVPEDGERPTAARAAARAPATAVAQGAEETEAAFGATRLLGGDEEGGNGGAQAPKGPGVAKETAPVAVLNGTDVPGAAADTGAQLKQANYKLGPVTNTPLPFDTSVVMFDAGGEETANQVAAALGITDVRAIDPDTKSVAEGANVVVVVGADRAGGSSGSTTDSTTATESEF